MESERIGADAYERLVERFSARSGERMSEAVANARVRELEQDLAAVRERLVEANRGWSDSLDELDRAGGAPLVGTDHPVFELVRTEGFTLVIDDQASERDDILGTPQRDELCAQACKGNVIAIRSGLALRDAFYAISHEIAESRLDFSGHHQAVWREQCAVLSRWCRKLYGAHMLTRREVA